MNIRTSLVSMVLCYCTTNSYAQYHTKLLSKGDNLGLSMQLRGLSKRSYTNKIDFFGNFSCGLFYNLVNSKKASIPVYLTYGLDGYDDFGRNSRKDYLELEIAYRRFLPFKKGPRLYVEGGIQSRYLLSKDTINLKGGNSLSFNHYNLIPKLSVGIELKKSIYLNLEYWYAVTNVIKYQEPSMKQYIGIRGCIVFRVDKRTYNEN